MKVLVACEESQTVCKAFRAKGGDPTYVNVENATSIEDLDKAQLGNKYDGLNRSSKRK